MIVLLLLSFQFVSCYQECFEAEALDFSFYYLKYQIVPVFSIFIICSKYYKYFTFYCVSGNDDWLVSPYNPNGVLATVINKSASWAPIPESNYIWEPSNCGVCNVTVTKHFFLIAQATKVNLYLSGDDYATATINNLNSCNGIYTVITPCDMTTATKPGLNELKIEVQNTGGPGGLAYLLEIKLQF